MPKAWNKKSELSLRPSWDFSFPGIDFPFICATGFGLLKPEKIIWHNLIKSAFQSKQEKSQKNYKSNFFNSKWHE